MAQFEQLGTERLDSKPAEQPGSPGSPESAPPAAPAEPPPSELLDADQIDDLKQRIIAALCTCFDPEIPVNIYELGLIYDVTIDPAGTVLVRMTLTTPACPAATTLPPEVQRKVEGLAGVKSAKVDVVWDPPWDKSRMSEAAKLQLGIDDW
jgi:FeS assembly SUF system protein